MSNQVYLAQGFFFLKKKLILEMSELQNKHTFLLLIINKMPIWVKSSNNNNNKPTQCYDTGGHTHDY